MMWTAFSQFVCSLLLWLSLNLLLLVHAQEDQSAGFISIDCGQSGPIYTETVTGLKYIPDSNFVDKGESKFILDQYLDAYKQPHQSLRSFPEGIRNCYNINTTTGTKYLIRTIFVYGNYDRQDKLPEFDLYVGPNLWDSVRFINASIGVVKELMYYVQKPKNYVQVCLVNKGSGIPLISAIELRPLPNSTYPPNVGPVALISRLDIGQLSPNLTGYRYPFDVLDRFWYGYNDVNYWTQLSSSNTNDDYVTMPSRDIYIQLPVAVMRTAATPKNANDSLNNLWPRQANDENADYYIYLHFAEVERLQANQSREFNITINGVHFYGPLAPTYWKTITIFNRKALKGGRNDVRISRTDKSTLPPILNGMETYILKEFSELETN